jgi:hypothetical protein
MTRVPQPPSLESKSPRFGIKDPKESWHAIYDDENLMVKMSKLVQKFENHFFRDEFPEKIVKQITSPKSALNYRSNETLFAESRVVSSPQAWRHILKYLILRCEYLLKCVHLSIGFSENFLEFFSQLYSFILELGPYFFGGL